MTTGPALPLVALIALGACCSPNSCRPARMGFAALAPATAAILAAGGAPADLGPALAAGGLRETPEGWAFPDGRGRMVPVEWDAARTELSFRYDDPGRNRCAWTPASGWECLGYY